MTCITFFLGYLCCLSPCVASHFSSATAESVLLENQDDVEQITNQKRITDLNQIAKPEQGGVINPWMRKDQILAALSRAKEARIQMDARIDALNNVLSKTEGPSESTTGNTHLIPLVCLCVALVLSCFIVWKVVKHENSRGQFEPIWYHDAPLMSTLLSIAVLLWLLCGIYAFSGLPFNEDQEPLTTIQAIYVSAQVLTTVGYGDFVPATETGLVIMALYVLFGVSLVATLFGNWISLYLTQSDETADGFTHLVLAVVKCLIGSRYSNMIDTRLLRHYRSITTLILYVIFSTLLWGTLTAEDKTYYEALWMTLITLTTVGFGYYTPVTETGRLIGAIWMLLGWVLMATAISNISALVIGQRRGLSSKASAMKFFEKVTQDPSNKYQGRMDRVNFLAFEMIRSGQQDDNITKALAMFDEIDTNHSEYLNYGEFQAYVKKIYGAEASR